MNMSVSVYFLFVEDSDKFKPSMYFFPRILDCFRIFDLITLFCFVLLSNAAPASEESVCLGFPPDECTNSQTRA